MNRVDVAIVGAGPAGLAAAVLLAEHGVDTALVDEHERAGGQIYRQLPETFDGTDPPPNASYAAGRELLAAVERAPLRRLQKTLTWALLEAEDPADTWTLALAGEDRLGQLAARHVLIATGAYDLPVAFPGWTLPGVMAAGGVQLFTKSEKLLPGRTFVLAGAHPLVLVIADQLLTAGADLAAVALAQPRPQIWDAIAVTQRLRGDSLRIAGLVAALFRLRRRGVPVLFSYLVAAAEGTENLEGVRLRPIDIAWRPTGGPDAVIACDTLALGYGFVPSTELARQAGCTHQWRSAAGGWVTDHDDWQRTTKRGISVAGEATGIAGAEQAADQGRLAALGMLQELDLIDAVAARRAAMPVRQRLRSIRRFTALMQERFEPRREALAALAVGDTVVCRCEEVTADQLREALAKHTHLGDIDAVKQLTRIGMGHCQGRLCQLTAAALTAEVTGRGLADLGAFTARPPVKPLKVGYLARTAPRSAPPPSGR